MSEASKLKSPLLRHLEAGTRPILLAAALETAALYRRQLRGVAFIGITGSAGKTTAKELTAAMLRTRFEGRSSPGSRNSFTGVARTVLGTTPRDRFCVIEVAAWEPRSVARIARVIRPRIGVVINVGLDHRSALGGSLGDIAREKGKLLESVTTGGTAVLNIDDPHVSAMAGAFPGRVITFGSSPEAMLRAHDVRSSWPERLSFTLRWDGRSLPISTRLCGRHWTPSVLAAIGAAVAMDVPLERAVAALEQVEPFPGRMSPVSHRGVTFIRDDWKAPQWSLGAAFGFLADAHSGRRIAVIGTISEGTGRDPGRYASAARRALGVADLVIFVGPKAKYARKEKAGSRGSSLHLYETPREAAAFLGENLRAGDLVLIKGSNRADHLLRLVLAYQGEVECWRVACGRGQFCDSCELLHEPADERRLAS